ncbi:unnamed protein product [Alopecurus aequalis]
MEATGDNYQSSQQYTIQTMNASLMRRATNLFSVMTGVKARMLTEIGFACLRRIGAWGWLDEHLTLWLLRHLDTETMCIRTSRATVIPVTDVDVSLVMGTQKDGPYIYEEASLSGEELAMMLERLSVSEDNGCLTIAHLEHLLCVDYDESSPEAQKDAFKTAAVMYSWAMIFSVSGTTPVIPYGLWILLADTSKIRDMNWSALVLKGVRSAAISIQGSLAAGERKLYITGCPLFLQVIYIDNLDYGMHTIENLYIPRIYQYTEENIVGFIQLDRDTECRGMFRQFGATRVMENDKLLSQILQLLPFRSVTGFVGKLNTGTEGMQLMEQLKEALKGNRDHLDKLGYIKKYYDATSSRTENIEAALEAVHLGNSNVDTSSPTRNSTRETGIVPYASDDSLMDTDYPLLTGNETGVVAESSDGSFSSNYNMEMVLYVPPTEQFTDETLAVVRYVNVKWATSNSDYPENPFDLNLAHPVVEKKRYRAMNRVLQLGEFDDRVWFSSSLIFGTIILGSELANQMKRGGAFSSRTCDAVILSLAEMDDIMYGTDRKHWKGYLPASFAEIVFGSVGDDYLNDGRVRDMFIGEHLGYDFEHCRKIVAPVEFDQTYSCYIWDVSAMDCHVLDPVLMNTSEKKAEEQHSWAVKFLTAALVKCVNTFFHGWRLPEGNWFMTASTNISQRCRPYNSAVYTLHYARWYNVQNIKRGITDSELGDIRGKMLYQIVSMEGNESAFVATLLSP